VGAAVGDEFEPELDAVVERAAADARLHHVWFLFRHVRERRRRRVRDGTDVVDDAVVEQLAQFGRVGLERVFCREVEGAVEFVVELGRPDLCDRLLSVRCVFVGA